MVLSIIELAQIREVVTQLLDELQLDAYLFEIEPRENIWEIKFECAVAEGWETITLAVEKEDLLHAIDDAMIRQRLLKDWRQALSACRLKVQQSPG